MGVGSWGGGIILGLVAVLWLVYLIPSWHKRQEYLATERNAVRLQQTLRILAQTAELPEEIRIEANAKSVASAQKVLRSEEAKREAIRRAQEAARQRAITRELAATAPALRAADSEPALAARRLRRTRLAATMVLLVSVVVVVVALVVVPGGWLFAVAGTVACLGSVAVLTQLAAVSRARARRAIAAPAVAAPVHEQAFQDFAPRVAGPDVVTGVQDPAADASETPSREWTPVAMPRPLYLRRGSASALARSSSVAGSPTTDADVDALRVVAEQRADRLRAAQYEALREVARAEAALQARRVRGAESDVESGVERETPASREAARSVEASGPVEVHAELPAEVDPPVPRAQAVARPSQSPFARMGYLDDAETQELRIDEVLQRRRAV